MALPTSYMTGGFSKIPAYFDTMLMAKAPEKFTIKFFENLGFKSSNDRLFINVLKSIGLLDEVGVPTNNYFEFMDQSRSKKVIAEGIRKAYKDLFEINKNAQDMSKKDIEGKFQTLTSGSKGPATISFMASTFKALCEYADWTEITIPKNSFENKTEIKSELENVNIENSNNLDLNNNEKTVSLNYDIHIHLPATRDSAIYDALFESLNKHIL